MPGRSLLLLAGLSFSIPGAAATKPAACTVGVVEGEVKAGQSFVRPIGGGLEIMLESLHSGWIVRVLPVGTQRPPHDYAELATPPYHSISPLLISTDYSFRAQDAIGWNVRRFRYAPDAASFVSLLHAYERYEAKLATGPAEQQALAELVARTPRATLTILDARLVPGTADQPHAASTVASHFAATPHTIDPPADGKPTLLGRVDWMRFRIEMEMPSTLHPAGGLTVRYADCGGL